ncbi:MAG: sulfurtransferase complex subunit TusB [Gammaproteobacteria bacterium]|jgi:tRNA 2-thiouridine synthesizing protein B|nr:sulfurtransferase complex subunit TusB [Gammaproteobacteria bacterium]MBT3490460.1 sulfurtransferase complex subunit TusB [Gammaproteobacteria bacterium]MBT3717609.1 sulfurtransferase complex subunit TusB [Gammaproteobacteria bacterium]MBT3845802.1 sulfurtransferase complex subunit TusB [Gammaproteobacteria bacterium]MBT3893590.1 sulfurtransferase complex subunit TusB [Gammaproteobacteria bacterium]
MLHIVNKSPFERDAFTSCMAHAAADSTVLLIEDGVFAAMKGSTVADQLSKTKVVALQSDVAARGIEANLADGVEMVDYAGFVDLVTDNEKIQSWV